MRRYEAARSNARLSVLCSFRMDGTLSSWRVYARFPRDISDYREYSLDWPRAFRGTLLLTDLGLLGWAMRRQPIHQVAAALAPWTWRGFALLMLTGPLMFTAQAAKWHDNPVFWIKMLLLAGATIFQLSVRRAIQSETSWGRPIGAVSLVLWISIGLLSKMMEFV